MRPINESVLHTLITEGMITEAEKPLRNRVEVIAVNDKGQVYGGVFPDGSWGTFGGGTDGEAGSEAAQREFEEETGHSVKGLKKCPVDPIEVVWRHEAQTEKDKERRAKYRGTKTWFFTGEFVKDDGKKAEGNDGKSPLKKVGWYDIKQAIKLIEDNLVDEPEHKAQQKRRVEALKSLET